MSWFLYNFLLKYLSVFLMSMVSSKRQLCHVETINFSTRQQMNKIAWNVSLKHLTARRATRASQCFTGMKGKIFLILRGRDFVSEKSFTLPVPFPSVYFYLLNIIITSREVLQKFSVWPSKRVIYLVALSPAIKFQSVYLMWSFVLFCLVFAAVSGTWS